MKLPLPVVVVFIGIVALLALVILRPKASTSVVASSTYTSGNNTEARVFVNGQAVDLATEVQSQSLSWLPAAAINSNQVYSIKRQKGKTTLLFVDGSAKELTDFDISNLPDQIKLQVTYEATQ